MASPIKYFQDLNEASVDEQSELSPDVAAALYYNAKVNFDLINQMPYVLFRSNGEYQSSRGGTTGSAEFVYSCTNGGWVTVVKTQIVIPHLPYKNSITGVDVIPEIGYQIYGWRNSASYTSQLSVAIDGSDIGAAQTITTQGNPPATPQTIKASRDLTEAEMGGNGVYSKIVTLELKFKTATGAVSTTWQIAGCGLLVVIYNSANVTW